MAKSLPTTCRPAAACFVLSPFFLLTVASLAVAGQDARVELPAAADATLFENAQGDLADGSGPHLFAGKTNGDLLRRALIRFLVADFIPAGATIQSATLDLEVDNVPLAPADVTGDLHVVTASWTEGPSNGGSPGGMGAPAEPNDATWIHRSRPSPSWATPGGDFSAPVVASIPLGTTTGSKKWESTTNPEMVPAVQGWLDAPAGNGGWILRVSEGTTKSARRFSSRENAAATHRPELEIEYSLPGQGGTSAGIFDPAASGFFLRNENSGGPADLTYVFGSEGAGWTPLAGDWSRDGRFTGALFDPVNGAFFLRNLPSSGPAHWTFFFGPPNAGWQAIAGDWDGDGPDTVGLYDPQNGVFFLRNEHANGPADATFFFGPPGQGWMPIAGDWNMDGQDTVGLYDPANGAFFLRNALANGPADETFFFGPPGQGWMPIAGDWNSNGIDTVGLYDPATGTFFLRNVHANGPADTVFSFGAAGMTPIAGDWD